MKKITRKMYAITQLKANSIPVNAVFGMPTPKEDYIVRLLEENLFDTEEQAIQVINDKGYIFAIIQDVYMTFTEVQWEDYDSNKPPFRAVR